jgi:tRNA(Ile)-lysidine synthase TilS/MesJ
VALFGQTAGNGALPIQARRQHADYACLEQLIGIGQHRGDECEFIHLGLSRVKRLKRLNEMAIVKWRP